MFGYIFSNELQKMALDAGSETITARPPWKPTGASFQPLADKIRQTSDRLTAKPSIFTQQETPKSLMAEYNSAPDAFPQKPPQPKPFFTPNPPSTTPWPSMSFPRRSSPQR